MTWNNEYVLGSFIQKTNTKRHKIEKLKTKIRVRFFYGTTICCNYNYVSNSFTKLETGIFALSSLQNSSKSVRLDGDHLGTAVFRSYHRSPIGFRYGLWLDHSSMNMFLSHHRTNESSSVCSSCDCDYWVIALFDVGYSWGGDPAILGVHSRLMFHLTARTMQQDEHSIAQPSVRLIWELQQVRVHLDINLQLGHEKPFKALDDQWH